MIFCVQTNSKNEKLVVGIADRKNGINRISNYLKSTEKMCDFHILCFTVNGVVFDGTIFELSDFKSYDNIDSVIELIQTNESFCEGKYLFNTNDRVALVIKEKQISTGYFYNTEQYTVSVIYHWEFIEFNNLLSQSSQGNGNVVPEKKNNVTIPSNELKTKDVYLDSFTHDGIILPIINLKLKNIRPNSSILIIGDRASGKTNLVREILKEIKVDLDQTTIISDDFSKYEDLKPNKHFDSIDDYRSHFYDDDNPEYIVIDTINDVEKRKFSYDSFHQSELIMTCQSIMHLPPEMRCHFGYIFVIKNEDSKLLNYLHDELLKGSYPNKSVLTIDQFFSVVKTVNEKDKILVIDRSNEWRFCPVCWY